ncbi:MAG: BTAD domain-containing putative transcriptional regulator [Acidimicrobiales bacterium]
MSVAAHGASPLRALVWRPRLVERLRRRFEVRLTTLTGGGGSGKTTLLAHAMQAETDHVDVWYPCTTADQDGGRLLRGIVDVVALGMGADPGSADHDPLHRLGELVLAAAPREVCLVVDDAHVLGRAPAIERLIESLPANGHVLLAGRTAPLFSTARLDASGQLEEIGQGELLLTPEEVIEFANLRGVDVASLASADGWPAFLELATTGTDARSRRYLAEEALAGLSRERRTALAAFAHVGGGDDELARAVAGCALEQLVVDLPLVRWSADRAQLHDLWVDLLAGELDDEQRMAAALAAAGVARNRREIDRAIDLASAAGAWEDVVDSISAAVEHGVGGGLSAHQLRRWRSTLPDRMLGSAVGVLLDGLLERERDQSSPAAIELFDQAARQFEELDDPALELVALTQLGYVTRVGGVAHDVAQFNERVARLAEKYPPAGPFVSIGRAWEALAAGRPDRQLAALEAVDGDALPPIWRTTWRHLIANALVSLGRAAEALTVVPREIDTLPVPIPGALITESQCTWYAGHPELAIAAAPRGPSARHGARDRFIAGAWRGLMSALAGDTAAAREALAEAEAHAGGAPGDLVHVQVVGLGLMIDLGEGDEDGVAKQLTSIIEMLPLGEGVSEQVFRNLFSVPYVLVPTTRPYWTAAPMQGIHAAVRTVVAAFTCARELDDLGPISSMPWPEPGIVAAHLPMRWCTELALHGVRANRHEGRRLAAWLAEHWQQPARQALQGYSEHDRLGDAARDVLARAPTPPRTPPMLRLLGHAEVDFAGVATSDPNWRRERVRALLCWMALNPHSTRDRAAGALWPDLGAERAAKNLRTTLNYLHTVLEPERGAGDAPWFVRTDGQRIALHASLEVDLWQVRTLLDEAEVAERAGHPRQALPLLLAAIERWRGDLAADLDYGWLDLERIHVRSRLVRAACRAAELLVVLGKPADAINAVRPALAVDPYYEPSYLVLAEAYRALGDHSASAAVLARARDAVGQS